MLLLREAKDRRVVAGTGRSCRRAPTMMLGDAWWGSRPVTDRHARPPYMVELLELNNDVWDGPIALWEKDSRQ